MSLKIATLSRAMPFDRAMPLDSCTHSEAHHSKSRVTEAKVSCPVTRLTGADTSAHKACPAMHPLAGAATPAHDLTASPHAHAHHARRLRHSTLSTSEHPRLWQRDQRLLDFNTTSMTK
eukprot:scaffold14273_cov60-Phaeocystis_antarctica.AAC.1